MVVQGFTFKVVNLRFKLLLPGPMDSQDSHNLVITATSGDNLRLALFERRQQGCEVKTCNRDYMWRIL